MNSIFQDLLIFISKFKNALTFIAKAFKFKLPKFHFFQHVEFAIFPKAKLTYWLADEEVVVYITNFKKKDRFSLAYKEIETGRIVIVNSGNPINYRLEQLKPNDQIEHTQVEQNQKY